MARLLYVCMRDPAQALATATHVRTVLAGLQPDNMTDVVPRVVVSGCVIAGISDGNAPIHWRGGNLAAGHLVDAGAWESPGSGHPDGAYAICRSDESVVEVLGDALASRTIWYALTDRLFVASTSQRAIVTLLGGFEFNPDAVPWMLAAGTLGPGQSWDRRIRTLAGGSSVTLDRASWALAERTEPIRFVPGAATDDEYQRRVHGLLEHVVSAADVSDGHWAITLSGGIDCRTILCLLPQRTNLRAITWGLRESLEQRGNDAYIARRLAQHFGLAHEYFETDLRQEPVERVFRRFLANSEGRIDHISAYMDGFALWRSMAQAGVRGILRGDEAFGRQAVHTVADVQAYVPQWTHFPGFASLESLGLAPQAIPEVLDRRPDESLATWRDRLQHVYRVPCILGALNDLKLPYVEIASPLISSSVAEAYRELPDRLRTDKLLLRRIAQSVSPDIPFATAAAIQPATDILKSPDVVELLRDGLSSSDLEPAIPADFVAYAMSGVVEDARSVRPTARRRLRRTVRSLMPTWVGGLRSHVTPTPVPNHNRLALRAYLVTQAARMYAEDAGRLASGR